MRTAAQDHVREPLRLGKLDIRRRIRAENAKQRLPFFALFMFGGL